MWPCVQVVDKGKEVHEEIIDKGLLEKHVELYFPMLWEISMSITI